MNLYVTKDKGMYRCRIVTDSFRLCCWVDGDSRDAAADG